MSSGCGLMSYMICCLYIFPCSLVSTLDTKTPPQKNKKNKLDHLQLKKSNLPAFTQFTCV